MILKIQKKMTNTAHQSKAPRATLQYTHTYSTHSTAGTDQFITLNIAARAMVLVRCRIKRC